GMLGESERESLVTRCSEAVRSIPSPLRTSDLLATLPEPLTSLWRESALQRALDASADLDALNRPEALRKLAPNLPEKMLPRAVAIALDMPEEAHLGDALGALAGRLSGELLQRGLKAARNMTDSRSRSWLLRGLIPRLEGEQRAEVIQEVLATLPTR